MLISDWLHSQVGSLGFVFIFENSSFQEWVHTCSSGQDFSKKAHWSIEVAFSFRFQKQTLKKKGKTSLPVGILFLTSAKDKMNL